MGVEKTPVTRDSEGDLYVDKASLATSYGSEIVEEEGGQRREPEWLWLSQWPEQRGRQLIQRLLDLEHEQFLHSPFKLHLQYVGIL